MSQHFNPRQINWTNAVYLALSPFIAIAGLWYWLKSGSFNWPTIILASVLYLFCQISITAGYHRLFSHRSYNAAWPVRLFFLVFGAAAFEGSAIHWSLDHRIHHNYVDDNEKDPYSIGKGFFWAHMGWLFFKQNDQLYGEGKAQDLAGDLFQDPLLVWQFKYWMFVGSFVTFVLPILIAFAWGDWFGGLIVAGITRSVLNHHATFLINSLSHCLGAQTYSDTHSARDNIFTAILTFGEGYHNYHHEFASDYRNGVRAWDWDPTKWVIKSLSLLGLAYDLKTIPDEIILRKRMQMKEKKMHKKLAKFDFNFFGTTQSSIMESLKSRYETAFRELSNLRMQMNKLAKERVKFKHDKSFIQLEVDALKDQISKSRREFLNAVREWNLMRKQVLAYARA